MSDSDTQVKRFVAPTMTRALELVKEEMGPEAVILSSTKVAGGIEIVTSVERDLTTRGISERRAFGQNFDTDLDQALDSDVSWQSQAGIEQAAAHYNSKLELNGADAKPRRPIGEDIAAEIERAREKMMAAKKRAAGEQVDSYEARATANPTATQKREPTQKAQAAPAREPNFEARLQERENEQKLESMRGELADLRMILEQQMWSQRATQIASQNAAHNSHQGFADDLGRSSLGTANAGGSKQVLDQHLSRLGLTDAIAKKLSALSDPMLRVSEAWKQSLARLARKIPIATNIDTNAGGLFAFIGPTGVGKTTTLTKLAAQYSIKHGPGKVAMISMDTHRVGAIEQLKALGRILEAPVRTVSKENGLMTTLASLKNYELILIDTAGYRQGDPKLQEQLAELDQCPDVKRMLVLSCLSQYQNLKASIHAYRPRREIDGCVISKLDEASSLGEAISTVVEHSLAVAYTTDGQQIPKDVHAATAHNLVASAVSMAKSQSLVDSASN